MSGADTPASRMRCLFPRTAPAASGTLTVTRTMSDPASASSMHCCAVREASAVSVMVIDCTATGAPPPTWTEPTRTPTVRCSFSRGMDPWIIPQDLSLNYDSDSSTGPAVETALPSKCVEICVSEDGHVLASILGGYRGWPGTRRYTPLLSVVRRSCGKRRQTLM